QNLVVFLQMADGVDDDTWTHHLRQHDYSRWFRNEIRDEELAAEAEVIEARPDGPGKDSRAAIRAAVEKRYTLPADRPSGMGVWAAGGKAQSLQASPVAHAPGSPAFTDRGPNVR